MEYEREIRRRVPAVRVAEFIDHYIKTNYELDPKRDQDGLRMFSDESGLNERTLYRIRAGENANVEFGLLDDILTRLDREYLWHWPAKYGGFSDYYQDEPAPPAEPTIEQRRRLEIANTKKQARKYRRDWREVLYERALAAMAEAA